MKGLNFDYRQTDRILWIRYRIRDWQCSWKKLYKLLAEEKHIFCVKIVLWFFFLGHLHFHFFPKMRFCPSIWRIQPSSKCRDSTNKSSIESCQQRRFVCIFLVYNTYSNKRKLFFRNFPYSWNWIAENLPKPGNQSHHWWCCLDLDSRIVDEIIC